MGTLLLSWSRCWRSIRCWGNWRSRGSIASTDKKLSLGFDKEFDADLLRERMPQLRGALEQGTGHELAVEIIVGASPSIVSVSVHLPR